MKSLFKKFTYFVLFIFIANINFGQSSSLVVTPNPLYAGKIPISSSETIPFKISNFSVNTVNVQSINIIQDGADFTIPDDPTPCSIDAFGELKLDVAYTPSASGRKSALVQIQTNAGTLEDSVSGYGTSVVNNIPTFERLIGFEDDLEINTVRQATDGGYILTGSTQLMENVNLDAYFIRTDKYGKQLFSRYFEAGTGGDSYDSGDDAGIDAVPLDDGSVIIMANCDSWGPGDFSIILSKWNAQGNFLWENAYGATFNDKGSRMILDSGGNIVIVGSTNNTSDQTENVFVLKINPTDGSLIWEKNYGENGGIQSGYDIVEVPGSGYVYLGNNQQGREANLYFSKIDYDGNQIWSKTYTNSIITQADRIQLTSDGGFVVCGYVLTDAKGKEGYVAKMDANAEMLWEKSFGTDHPDDFNGVIEAEDGGFICVGTINQTFSYEQSLDDLWLFKTDQNGNQVWEKRLGGELDDTGSDILSTNDGGFIVLGNTGSFTTDEDRVYFLHLNQNADITNVKQTKNESVSQNFKLYQNYPNPFNPSTLIQFDISASHSEKVILKVYDVLGREISMLVNDVLSPGSYQVEFNALSTPGKSISSGIYFYKLTSGNNMSIKKMILIK